MMNKKAQLNMFEAITAIAIIIMAVFFVRSFYGGPSLKVAASSDQLETYGEDILRTLDQPSSNIPDKYHNSLLVKYIVKNESEDFSKFVENLLPGTALYSIYIYNVSGDNLSLWYPTEELPKAGNIVRSTRAFVYKGFLFEVQLEVWYI